MNDALLGGLIAAGTATVTVAVPKIIEMIQRHRERKQEHSYAMRKLIFEKRLQVCEEAVSQLNYVKSAIHIAKDMLLLMLGSVMGNGILEPEVGSMVAKSLECICEKIKEFDVSSISLYVDVDLHPSNHFLFNSMHTLSVLIYLKRHLDLGNISSEDDKQKALDTIIQNLDVILKDLEELDEKIDSMLQKITSSIRQEIR